MTIGFAVLLDHKTHNFIRKIQVELNHQFGFRISRQFPHITIKAPFEVDDLEPYIDFLETFAASMSSFKVTLN